jgi:hypothetical protein
MARRAGRDPACVDSKWKAPAPAPHLTLQMPHVSCNTALKRWLMVFCVVASEDGIHFGKPIKSMRLPAFNMKRGDTFTAYPTLVSPDKATQTVTGEEGFLYFARGPRRLLLSTSHDTGNSSPSL